MDRNSLSFTLHAMNLEYELHIFKWNSEIKFSDTYANKYVNLKWSSLLKHGLLFCAFGFPTKSLKNF